LANRPIRSRRIIKQLGVCGQPPELVAGDKLLGNTEVAELPALVAVVVVLQFPLLLTPFGKMGIKKPVPNGTGEGIVF